MVHDVVARRQTHVLTLDLPVVPDVQSALLGVQTEVLGRRQVRLDVDALCLQ